MTFYRCAGFVELLRHLGPAVVIPEAAKREIQRRSPADPGFQALLRVVEVHADPRTGLNLDLLRPVDRAAAGIGPAGTDLVGEGPASR